MRLRRVDSTNARMNATQSVPLEPVGPDPVTGYTFYGVKRITDTRGTAVWARGSDLP